MEIEVNSTDGTIERFYRMPDYPYNGPSVPRVSKKQAIQIASQFAPYDAELVPFDEVSLQIEYDMYQIPYLTWHLHQKPPVFDSRFNSPGFMSVDAMTGRFSPGPAAFGGGGWGKPNKEAERFLNKNVKPLPPPPARIIIRKPDGKPIGYADGIVRQSGQVWLRAELLRDLGATVDAQPKTLHITLDKRELTEKSVGAKYHDYGWWVPLDKTMQAIGGRMAWNDKTQEAIVEPDTPIPTPAPPKPAP